MNLDFLLDDEKDNEFEFGNTRLISRGGNGLRLGRKKRSFETTFQGRELVCSKTMRRNVISDSTFTNPQIHASVDPSICSSLSPSSQTKNMKSQASSVSIKQHRRPWKVKTGRQKEADSSSNNDDTSCSAHSQITSCVASSTSDFTRNSLSTIHSYSTRKRNQLSVYRGAGCSVHAVQDAGTYQMIHDECSYLCSTILSKTSRSSKTVDAAIDLATLLSCRKTRSMLWQGETYHRETDAFVEDDNQRVGSLSGNGYLGSTAEIKKQPPIPKVWSSILEVLALSATTNTFFHNNSSSNCSFSSDTVKSSTRAPTTQSSAKYRTKSARRKEKKFLETNDQTISTMKGTTKKHWSASSKAVQSHILKDVLACIFYFVSCDCTMSRERSIAAMGAVKSRATARRIRLAILDTGSALKGIMQLMTPSEPLATIVNTEMNVSFSSTLLPTTSSIPKRCLRSESMKSSSSNVSALQVPTDGSPSIEKQAKMLCSSKTRDPTAIGRRRKNRRKLNGESCFEASFESGRRKIIPPSSNRCVTSLRCSDHGSDELSFDDLSAQRQPFQKSQKGFTEEDDRNPILPEISEVEASPVPSYLIQKVKSLRTKIIIESISKSRSSDTAKVLLASRADNEESIYFQTNFPENNSTYLEGDRPWLSIVCLESLTRILTGTELHGKNSCLEEEETSKDDDDKGCDGVDQNHTNVVTVTNRLVGKSGVIPLLSCAMSQSMKLATKLVFSTKCQADQKARNRSIDVDDEYWNYCHNRLKLLASLIDEACFFSERNRRNFCEDDPFSFKDRKKGLIFHILMFLHQCSQCNLNHLDQKRSETMTLALRTLTSLTHDNLLAAKQMEICNHRDVNFNDASDSEKNILGIRVLARLVFQLTESPLLDPPKPRISSSLHVKSVSDHDMHRYDGTIFCLTTLANITEGADIGKVLTEIKVELKCGKILSWVEWLCHWLIRQTETFRQEILSIGDPDKLQNGYFSAATAEEESKDLQQDEEEKLVAAGNGCVVLACLITESEDRNPDFSISVRKLIKKQMPLCSDGSPSGLIFVVNTLKAYCNYYHISMGDMSVAVVSPVRRLISELEEIVKIDMVPQISTPK